MTSRRGDRRHQEQGSALILALIFVTVFGLIVAAILSFSEVGLRASRSHQLRVRSSFAADGAISTAINRYSTAGPCDDYSAPPINGAALSVRCDGPSLVGARATQPANALLSLGTGPGDGISSNADLRLLGDVFSTTTVSTNATMIVQGDVSARGCPGSGTIEAIAPGVKNCARPAEANSARGRDPDYTKAISEVPVLRTVEAAPAPPDCTAASWLVKIEPGYYDDAAAFSALTGPGSCNDRVVWFQPGAYYFDFGFRGGADLWTVDNPSVVVVGGTPRGWIADPARPRPVLKVPGSCRTAADVGPNDGVQLIAGGATRLSVLQGRMELCATPSSTEQQIAMFGLRTDLAVHALEATDIRAEGFTNIANAQSVAEVPAATVSATLRPTLTTLVSLDLTGFRPGVPTGSLITSALLEVHHQETGDVGPILVTVTFPGSTCGPQTLGAKATMTPETIDLKATCGLDSPEDLTQLKASYATSLLPAGVVADVAIDGLVAKVAYNSGVVGPVVPPLSVRRAATATSADFANPDRAKRIAETPSPLTADATISGVANSATLNLRDFTGAAVPSGSRVDTAKLRVAHKEGPNIASVGLVATYPGGTCPSAAVPLSPALATFEVDLVACGLRSPDQLAGLVADYTATRNGTPTTLTQVPTTVAAVDRFDLPDNARRIDGKVATATLLLAPPSPLAPATITLRGYDQSMPPPGTTFASATLRVAHQENAVLGAVTPSVAVGFLRSTCATSPRELAIQSGAVGVDTVDLGACGLTNPDQLAGLQITYAATAAGVLASDFLDGIELVLTYNDGVVAQLDGVELDVVFQAPAFRPLCTDCDLVTVTPVPTDSATRFVVNGTIYAPTAGVDINMFGLKTQVLNRGVIARKISLGLRADPSYRRPAAAMAPKVVRFTAYPDRTLTPGTVANVTGFTDPDNAKILQEEPTDLITTAMLDGTDASPANDAASLVFRGFQKPGLAFSGGIDGATLRIRHQDDGNTLRVTIRKAGAVICGETEVAPHPTSPGETQIPLNLAACGLNPSDPAAVSARLGELTVTYAVALAPMAGTATATLDGVSLLVFSRPLVRASVTFSNARATVDDWSVLR